MNIKSEELHERLNQIYNSDKLPWIIICIGIFLRLARYLHNPSLWFDEVAHAEGIITQSLSSLLNPSIDYTQTTPFFFYVITKLSVDAFGNSEYALRLYSQLCGIASLFLFYIASKQYLKPAAVPFALGLFAILDPLVTFSAEIKPYEGDVAFSLLLITSAAYFQSKNIRIRHIAIFGASGIVAIWFSNPSVFVLAGIGTILALFSISRKELQMLGRLFIIFSVWGASFIVYYFVYLRNILSSITTHVGIDTFLHLENAFMPFPPASLADIKWFIDTFFETFNYPVGISLEGIAALFFLLGCVSLFSRKKEHFFVLISPVLVTLIAAALHKYPFKGRVILFLVPIFVLITAEGIDHIRSKTEINKTILRVILIGLLFLYPVSWAAYHAINPSSRGEIRPVLGYIKDNWKDGDIVYVHFFSQYAFRYYSKYHPDSYDFNDNDVVIGIAPRLWYTKWRKQDVAKYYNRTDFFTQTKAEILSEYMKDLDALRGHKRVWVLFSGKLTGAASPEFFVYYLDMIGKQQDSFGDKGIAIVYLYNLAEGTDQRNN